MSKPRPGAADTELTVRGSFAAFRSGQPSWADVSYECVSGSQRQRLDGVQWADWDWNGRLLVATTNGALEIREDPLDTTAAWSVDLGSAAPAPAEPPAIARHWTIRG
jgi:hypothetical protein